MMKVTIIKSKIKILYYIAYDTTLLLIIIIITGVNSVYNTNNTTIQWNLVNATTFSP